MEPSGTASAEHVPVHPPAAAITDNSGLQAAEPTQADQVLKAGRAHDEAPSLWAYPATYMLLAANILVFALMFSHGPVPALWKTHHYGQILTAPFSGDLVERFGGSDRYLIFGRGQWWRLLSSTFVHVTILHLAVNMWCLWNLGLFGEPLLGRRGLLAVYLLTGTFGMMVSLFWNIVTGQYGLVAGASGAVFGVAGILIVLLSNRKLSLPWESLRSLRRSVMWFAGLNLLFGLAPRWLAGLPAAQLAQLHMQGGELLQVDNSAHLGGFAAGLLLGLPLFPRMTSGRSSYRARQTVVFGMATFLLLLLCYGIAQFATAVAHGK